MLDSLQPLPKNFDITNQPWIGFWQVLNDSANEDIVPFRNSTIALRQSMAFVILTQSHFMEIRTTAKRQGPLDWPPTESEAVSMFRGFSACAGQYQCKRDGNSLHFDQTTTMASNPRLEGINARWTANIDGNNCIRRLSIGDIAVEPETLQRLSGPGTSPLSGAWRAGSANDRWMYLVTAGHYGIIRVESGRPMQPKSGHEFNDDELYAIWQKFGANAGARLETKATFDHWPMIAQLAGYEVRKHETFRIEVIEQDRFVASISPDGVPETWYSIES